MNLTNSNLFGPSFSCAQCDSLRTLSSFPSLEVVVVPDDPGVVQAHTSIRISCFSCPEITSLGNLGSFTRVEYPSSGVDVGLWTTMECFGCDSLTTFANLSSLSSLIQDQSSLNFSCSGCASLDNFLPEIDPSQFDPNQALATFHFKCEHCPSLKISFSGTYTFLTPLPTSFVLSQGVLFGLELRDLVSSTLPDFPSTRVRLYSLAIRNSSSLSNLDAFSSLEQIDRRLTITGCQKLRDIDAFRISLFSANEVEITNNPMLCPGRVSWIESISTSPPIVSGNGLQATTCDEPILPLPPMNLTVSRKGRRLHVAWINPAQPSAYVSLSLIMNGVEVLAFFAGQPESQFETNDLPNNVEYVFLMTASYEKQRVFSTSFSITIPSGAEKCPAGSIPTNLVSPRCQACLAGSFQKEDRCILCA